MKKLLTILMSTLMVFTSFGASVYAEEVPNPSDTKPTNLSYEVTSKYEWSVPTAINFTKDNFEDVSAIDNDSQVKITECVIPNEKTLIIYADKSNDFKLEESHGHTLDYAVYADGKQVQANETILSLNAGEHCDDAQVDITATLTKDANEIAGEYEDKFSFVAEIVNSTNITIVEESTTATNVEIKVMPTELQTSLKDELKNEETDLTENQINDAIVLNIESDTSGDVVLDVSKFANVGDVVLVYHKSATNGWELVGQGIVDSTGIVTCTFEDYSPIVVSAKRAGLYDSQGNLIVTWEKSGLNITRTDRERYHGEDENFFILERSYPNTETIILPEGIKTIGKWSFGATSLMPSGYSYNYGRLKTIVVPDSVTTIGGSAFEIVENVVYSGSATGAPWGADTVNAYRDGDYAYSDETKTVLLKYYGTSSNIVIPDGVKEIAKEAFYYNKTISTVEIPNSVESIGERAFANCNSLTSVIVPNSVTSIGSSAFFDALHVSYSGTATGSPWGAKHVGGYLENGFIYSDSTKTTLNTYIGNDDEVTIPDTVKTISAKAFYNLKNVSQINIPSTVTSIGSNAFYWIPNINYSGSASGSPWGAKYKNQYAQNRIVYTNSNKTEIVKYFDGNDKSVLIPASVIKVGDSAFKNCALTSIVFEENSQLKTIDAYAFSCSNLTSFTIPDSVTSIGSNAFYSCTKIALLDVPNSVTSIGNNAFSYKTNVKYSGTATGAPWGAAMVYACIDGDFAYSDLNKTRLIKYTGTNKNIVIPDNVKAIGAKVFYDTANYKSLNMESVVLPDGLRTIETDAFYNSGLTKLNIPTNVESIQPSAFANTIALTYNGSLEDDGSHWGAMCVNAIEENDFLMSQDGKTIFKYNGSKSVLNIPSGVTAINYAAFSGCSSLTSVTIPNTVTSIGDRAFYNCSELATVTFEENSQLTLIGKSAFYSCSKLSSITIPENVTSIGEYAFHGCALKSFVFPNSAVTLGNGILEHCKSLENVTFNNNDEIPKYTCQYCESLKEITIPSAVKTIGQVAFWQCPSLETVNFSEGLEIISDQAFQDDTKLKTLVFPSTLKEIGVGAFEGCSSLKSATFNSDPAFWTVYKGGKGSTKNYHTNVMNSATRNASDLISEYIGISGYVEYYWVKDQN